MYGTLFRTKIVSEDNNLKYLISVWLNTTTTAATDIDTATSNF
jgi:hypothetical protein